MPTKTQIGEIVKVGLVAPSGRSVQNGIIVVIEIRRLEMNFQGLMLILLASRMTLIHFIMHQLYY
jgi:hypothetical protein